MGNNQGIQQFDFEAFRSIIHQLEYEYPQKNIDGKILHFLQQSMHKGKPAMADVDLNNPDPSPPYEQPVRVKKALLIGINYIGSQHSLQGCINDVKHERNVLTAHFGFPDEDIMASQMINMIDPNPQRKPICLPA